MRRSILLMAILILATSCALAQDENKAPLASEIFMETLESAGLEAASLRFREIFADTTGAYTIDAYQFAIALPERLRREGRAEMTFALLDLLQEPYGDHPRYWQELGKHHLYTGDVPAAEEAWRQSLVIMPEQPQLAWMIENLKDLAKTVKLQLATEERWTPGENTGLLGPYLGQDPPGDKPEVFAPGILNSLEHEYSISFSPDGREIYFSRSPEGTFVCRWEAEGWTAPELVTLIDDEHLTEEASVSPDGKRIFFCSRLLDMSGPREIFVAEREGEAWGEAHNLFTGMYPTATLDGTLYYTEITGRPDYGILVRRKMEGEEYCEAEVLPEKAADQPTSVNTGALEAHPYISPDGNLLIFDSNRAPNPGLFLSFRQDDGRWGETISLSDQLGIPPSGQPALSPDGRFLFFCLAGDMWWMDAGFLSELRTRPLRGPD